MPPKKVGSSSQPVADESLKRKATDEIGLFITQKLPISSLVPPASKKVDSKVTPVKIAAEKASIVPKKDVTITVKNDYPTHYRKVAGNFDKEVELFTQVVDEENQYGSLDLQILKTLASVKSSPKIDLQQFWMTET